MADEFPFEISPMFEGERVRKDDMYVELAGPKSKGFELVNAVGIDEIEDGKFTLIGPDVSEMEEGGRYPLAMIYRIAGELVEPDLEAIVETGRWRVVQKGVRVREMKTRISSFGRGNLSI